MLAQLIGQHAAALVAGRDWDAIANVLNAATIEISDPTPLTYGRIGDLFGDDAREAIAAAMRMAARDNGELADAHLLMLSTGVAINTDKRQALIRGLGAANGWPVELVDAIAGLGMRMVSPAHHAGLESVTAEQCRTAWEFAARQARVQDWRERFDAACNAYLSGSVQAEDVAAIADEMRGA